jgi:hypothetical protein
MVLLSRWKEESLVEAWSREKAHPAPSWRLPRLKSKSHGHKRKQASRQHHHRSKLKQTTSRKLELALRHSRKRASHSHPSEPSYSPSAYIQHLSCSGSRHRCA